MLTKQLVHDVQSLLSDPAHWTRGAYARDEVGESVPPDSSRAVCWCLEGAFRRAGASPATVYRAEKALAVYTRDLPLGGYMIFPGFNDSMYTTYADIHAFLTHLLTILEE